MEKIKKADTGMKSIYQLIFSDKIGKMILISEPGHTYCGEWIAGRIYTGTLQGVFTDNGKTVVKINDRHITITIDTLIKFM